MVGICHVKKHTEKVALNKGKLSHSHNMTGVWGMSRVS